MAESVKFLEMFPCCEPLESSCGGLNKAAVLSASVSTGVRTINLTAMYGQPSTPEVLVVMWIDSYSFFVLRGLPCP
ncbi:MAG: hypothetical protein LUE97_03035, partial [Oscillospiraceae bacterium]|nr:hypothetical protein [Oscillospiraceae bacterium]